MEFYSVPKLGGIADSGIVHSGIDHLKGAVMSILQSKIMV